MTFTTMTTLMLTGTEGYRLCQWLVQWNSCRRKVLPLVIIREIVHTDRHSWNKDLARDRGMHMGQEFRHKGVHVLLGPVVGPIGRVATGGRNWEGFSSDPYHTGVMGAETIKGMQSRGVSASIKVRIISHSKKRTNSNSMDSSIISAMNRSSTVTLKMMTKESMLSHSHLISMIRRFTSSTSGPSRMLCGLGVRQLCARTSELTTRMDARTVRR